MRRVVGLLSVALAVVGVSVAQAQDATWLVNPSSGNFNTGANWSTGTVPTGTASFGTSNAFNINFSSSTSLGGLTFTGNTFNFTLGGTSIVTLTGAGIVNNTSNNQIMTIGSGARLLLQNGAAGGGSTTILTINSGGAFDISGTTSGAAVGSIQGAGDILLGSKQLTVGNSASTTESGVISGVGGSLVKTGTGTLTLSGANTYSGDTILNAGTLRASESSLGNGGSIIFNGGTLDVGGMTTSRSAVLNSTGFLIVDAGGIAWNGVISGNGGLTASELNGSNNLFLRGANTYAGDTTIIGTTLRISSDSNLGNGGNLALTSGTLATSASFASSRNVVLTTLGTFQPDGGTTLTLNGIVSGTGGLTMNGDGTLVLGGTNTNSGTITLNRGTLSISADGNLGNAGNSIQFANGTLETTSSFTTSRAVQTNGSSRGALFQVDAGTTTTWNGVISGGVGLVKSGGGTLVLGGSNTYGSAFSDTEIDAGTLQVSADNNLGNSGGVITFVGGTLKFGAAFDLSSARRIGLGNGSGTIDTNGFDTVISQGMSQQFGNGTGFTKTGLGTLTLAGTNDYTGGTTVAGGTLALGVNGGSVGSLLGAVTVGSNGTFNLVNANTSALTGITNNGTVTFSNSSSAGTFNITSSGAGAQLNFFDNSSAGTSTIVNTNGSLLSFDDSSTAGSATITNNGGSTMCFCNNATAGTANITNIGAGSLLQFSNNTAAGNATITNGTGATVQFLVDSVTSSARYIGSGGTLDASSLTTIGLGSIEGSGTVDLGSASLTVGNNGLSTAYSGVIGGTGGSLIKTGTGSLTLSGANTFTGGMTVGQGALMVTGSLASGVTVNSGGTLGGSGTITGNVVNSGMVAPGSFNTLSVTGNYMQSSGGAYIVVANNAGQSGRLSITGNATLGGAVNVQAVSGVYVASTNYTILSATGTISGAFSGVTSNFAFLTPRLSYGAHAVTLTLTQGPSAFASGAQSGNQRSVGVVLDQARPFVTGDFANVLDVLVALDAVQGPRALDAIGGQNYAGFSTVSVQSATAFMNAFASQIGSGNGGSTGRVAMLPGADDACDLICDTDLPRWGVWGGGLGGAGTVAGDQGSHGTSYNFGGFAGGLDYRFDPKFLAGVTVGYTAANLYTQGMDGTGHSGTVQLGLYGEFTEGAVYLDGLAGYARGQNQMQRPIVIPGLQPRTASSQTTVDQFFGQLETGYRIELGGTARAFVTPFARLQASTATQAGFSETGADSLDLTVAGQTTNSLRTVVGAVLGGSIGKATTRFRLGWSHEFADTSRPVTASFAGAPALSFTTMGAAAPREGAVLGLSVDAPLAEQTSLYARYDGDLEGGNTSHIFSAGVRYVW